MWPLSFAQQIRPRFVPSRLFHSSSPSTTTSTSTSTSTVCCLPLELHCNCVCIRFSYPPRSRCPPRISGSGAFNRFRSQSYSISFPPIPSRSAPALDERPLRIIPAQPLSHRPSHRTQHPAIQLHPAAVKRTSPAPSKHNFVPATCVTEHPTVPPKLVLRVALPPTSS